MIPKIKKIKEKLFMKLTDQWISGFADGDGCFRVYRQRHGHNRYIFVISQHARSKDVLYGLKTRFGCGSVSSAGGYGTNFEYKVTNKKHLMDIIIPFFLRNPLQTIKSKDFEKFAHSLFNEQFLTPPTYQTVPLTQDWLVGFIDAESNYYVSMTKNYPRPQFTIGLHGRDRDILEKIKDFIKHGVIYEKTKSKAGKTKTFVCYQISNQEGFDAILKMCMTSTNRCLLKTTKRVDFLRFKQIIQMISRKEHLTAEGIIKINIMIQANRHLKKEKDKSL